MRLTSAFWVTVLVLLATGATLAEGVIKVDPNAGVAVSTSAEPIIENDPRLDQKITYNGGYKRLHAVVDDLSQLTRVTIYSGLSPQNWQVRDIPVVVCVKDLPLGKVLQAIADAAHLRLSSRKIEEQGKVTWTYRLSRSVKDEADINTCLQKKHDSELENCKWAWEAMKSYGKQPELKDVDKRTHLIAQIISSLDSSAEADLMAGKVLHFTTADPKYGAAVKQLYQLSWEALKSEILGWEAEKVRSGLEPAKQITLQNPTSEHIEQSRFDLKLYDQGSTGNAGITTHLVPIYWEWEGGNRIDSWRSKLTDMANELKKSKDIDLPTPPEEYKQPDIAADMADPEMVPLTNDEAWSRPEFDTKLDLKRPKDKTPVFSDLLLELAEKSGFNIICEDFTSHHSDYSQKDVTALLKDGVTTKEALQASEYGWFINDQNKLLIGWARGADWRKCQASLVPEELLISLRTKLDNEGVGIRDIASLINLSSQQYTEWILTNRDMGRLFNTYLSDQSIWKLYSLLKPEDKDLAESDSGCPLVKLDSSWISNAFLQRRMSNGDYVMDFISNEETIEREKNEEDIFTNPKIISTMSLRLTKLRPLDHQVVRQQPDGRNAIVNEPFPKELDQYKYTLQIEYTQNGEKQTMSLRGPSVPLPVYSVTQKAANPGDGTHGRKLPSPLPYAVLSAQVQRVSYTLLSPSLHYPPYQKPQALLRFLHLIMNNAN